MKISVVEKVLFPKHILTLIEYVFESNSNNENGLAAPSTTGFCVRND
jgi:hypothetical protein